MKRMRKFLALLLALVVVLSFAACGSGTTTTDEGSDGSGSEGSSGADGTTPAAAESGDPVMGGSLTMYWQEFYNSYDPSLADNRNYALWFERLWSPNWDLSMDEYDWSSEYVTMDHMTNQLLADWSWDADAQELSATLRDDVVFQTLPDEYDYYGGRALTADDVAWSYRRLTGLDGVEQCESEQDWSSKIYMLESVEVVDDLNLIFHFNTSSETALNDFIIAGVCIGGVEWDSLTADQQSDWHYACGTGPFVISDYVADSYMTLTKNPDYYMYDDAGNQLPYLDEVTLVCITDTSNVVAQFIAGDIDMVGWGNDVINTSEKQQIRDSLDASAFVEYSYTTNPCGVFLKMCHPALAELNVRKALQQAIDLETVTTAYYGYDVSELQVFGIWSQSTAWSSVSEWDDELLSEYTYDPENAKALLEEAGYGDGFEFGVVLFSAMDVDLYTYAAEMLKENLNVTMNIETVSTPPEMQAVGLDTADERCIPGTVCLYGISGGIQNYASYGNNNNSALNDPVLDAMCDALQAATSMDEQTELAKDEDMYVAQMHYTLQLGPCEKVNSYISSRVGGYSGQRPWKNWNVTTVLTNIWVTDGQ